MLNRNERYKKMKELLKGLIATIVLLDLLLYIILDFLISQGNSNRKLMGILLLILIVPSLAFLYYDYLSYKYPSEKTRSKTFPYSSIIIFGIVFPILFLIFGIFFIIA